MRAPEVVHQRLVDEARPALSFDPDREVQPWRAALNERLRTVLGLDTMPEPVVPDVKVEWTATRDTYTETRFVFASEPGAGVPCHLLVPHNSHWPVPVVLCLQGHSPGMHVSLGRAGVSSMEPATTDGDRDFALQVVSRGWAALVLEQRAFGERESVSVSQLAERDASQNGCSHPAHVALLLGRTLNGERVWDVLRALDVLSSFPEIDASRIACMGNSTGGLITWYAACLDTRISIAMPSCAVMTYRGFATGKRCCCGHLPGVLRHFDMQDLAGLLAPRPLIVVAGREDSIIPFAYVEECFATINQIYTVNGAADQCALVVGDEGHRFYADASWPVFEKLSGWPDGNATLERSHS